MADAPNRKRLDNDLVRYLDAFNPPPLIASDARSTADTRIIPPLLGALSDQGISAYVTHDLNYILSINKSSQGEMVMIQMNDPRCHPNASRADTCVMALVRNVELVGCIASRLIWCERSLAEETRERPLFRFRSGDHVDAAGSLHHQFGDGADDRGLSRGLLRLGLS